MPFKLYYHPLSSFCQKVTIALYENDIPFDGDITDVVSPEGRAAFVKVWPIVKFPVLRDEANGRIVPESSIIIEYVQNHAHCKILLVPSNPDRAHEVRLWDRFFDLHVNTPMQKVMGDRRRPDGSHDPFGVTEARDAISTAYGVLETAFSDWCWAAGADFRWPTAPPPCSTPTWSCHSAATAVVDYATDLASDRRARREAEPYLQLVPR